MLAKRPHRKGFTLIELLVVIAIIGILSAVVLASLNVARARARDAKRLSDIHQIAKALEMYALQNGGTYPSGAASSNGIGGAPAGWNTLRVQLAPYIELPDDPIGTSRHHYVYHGYDTVCGDNARAVAITIRRLEILPSPNTDPCSGVYSTNHSTYHAHQNGRGFSLILGE